MAEEIDFEKCNFWNFRNPVTLTLYRVIRHTVLRQSLTSIYIPNFTEIGKTFCGRMYGRTYLATDIILRPPLLLLGRRGEDDLIKLHVNHVTTLTIFAQANNVNVV